MSFAPRYPSPFWECGICGNTNPGDLGFCPSCKGGALVRGYSDSRPSGGLEHGAIPYFPVWHIKEFTDFEVNDGMLPLPEKYPHHKP